MHGNPDADIMRDIVQLLRERIEQGLLTIFIKIKDIYNANAQLYNSHE